MQSRMSSDYYGDVNAADRSLCVPRDLSAYCEYLSYHNETWGGMISIQLEPECCTCSSSTDSSSNGSISTHTPSYPLKPSPPCCGVSGLETSSSTSLVFSYVRRTLSGLPQGSQRNHYSTSQMLIRSSHIEMYRQR